MGRLMGETEEKMGYYDYEKGLLNTLIRLLQKEKSGFQLTDQEKMLWNELRDYDIR